MILPRCFLIVHLPAGPGAHWEEIFFAPPRGAPSGCVESSSGHLGSWMGLAARPRKVEQPYIYIYISPIPIRSLNLSWINRRPNNPGRSSRLSTRLWAQKAQVHLRALLLNPSLLPSDRPPVLPRGLAAGVQTGHDDGSPAEVDITRRQRCRKMHRFGGGAIQSPSVR